MQKQPKYPKWFSPTSLPEEFPLYVSKPNIHCDAEITALHLHDAFELGLCLEGSGILVVEGRVMSFHTGDVFVVSPRESHLAQSTPGTNSRWIWIYADIEKLLCQFCEEHSLLRTSHFAGENFRNVISPSAQPRLCQLLRDFCEEAQRETPFKHDSLRALLLLIMAELQRLAPEGAERPGGEPDSMARIQKALVYLIQHYREKLRLDDLARLCAVSRTHFRRLFRQALGHSPQDHLNQIRIMMSVAELRQNRKSISEIALSCGFPSLSSFNRQFKAQMGKAPREWRRSSVDKGLFL